MEKLQDFVDNTNAFAEAVGDDIKALRQRQEDIIDDSQSSSETTYSSQKIDAGFAEKVNVEPGKQLSDENYTLAEKQKLASLEGSKFKGVYPSLTALNTAHPTAEPGAYADVDSTGVDVVRYIWDVSDSEWIPQQSGTPLTASQVKQLYESNPDTNAYTNTEKTKLSGIQTGAQVNTVTSVAGKTGAVTINIDDIPNLQDELDEKADISDIPTAQQIDNWNTAYGRGDFRDYGLGNRMDNSNNPSSWNWDNISLNSIHRGSDHGIADISSNIYGITLLNSTVSKYGIHIAGHHTNRLLMQGNSPTNTLPWVEFW